MNPASTKKHSFASLSLLLLFLLLAVAKLSAVIFPSPAFLAPDPVFRQFELRETIFIAAIAELAAAFVFLKLGNRQASYFASAWVITPILVYRISLLVTMSKSTCGCFGRLPNYLGLSNSTVNMTTVIILFTSVLLPIGNWPTNPWLIHSRVSETEALPGQLCP